MCRWPWLSVNPVNVRPMNPNQQAKVHSDSLTLGSPDSRRARANGTFVGDRSTWKCLQLYLCWLTQLVPTPGVWCGGRLEAVGVVGAYQLLVVAAHWRYWRPTRLLVGPCWPVSCTLGHGLWGCGGGEGSWLWWRGQGLWGYWGGEGSGVVEEGKGHGLWGCGRCTGAGKLNVYRDFKNNPNSTYTVYWNRYI